MNRAKAGSSRGGVSAELSKDIIADSNLSDEWHAIRDDDAEVELATVTDAVFDRQLYPARDGCISLSVLRSIPC